MYKSVTTKFMSGTDNQIASSNKVGVTHQICSAADLRQVLMSLSSDAKDVRTALVDLPESLSRTRNRLVNNNCFHLRVIRKINNGLYGCFKLFRKVIGIDG